MSDGKARRAIMEGVRESETARDRKKYRETKRQTIKMDAQMQRSVNDNLTKETKPHKQINTKRIDRPELITRINPIISLRVANSFF